MPKQIWTHQLQITRKAILKKNNKQLKKNILNSNNNHNLLANNGKNDNKNIISQTKKTKTIKIDKKNSIAHCFK